MQPGSREMVLAVVAVIIVLVLSSVFVPMVFHEGWSKY